MQPVFHTFIVDLILINFSFLFLEIMVSHMATFYNPQVAREWRTGCRFISRFDIDEASSWWRFRIAREGCYEIKNTSIFAWFSIPGIGHYHWLCDLIRQLPPNSKGDYLVRTIRRILDFL